MPGTPAAAGPTPEPDRPKLAQRLADMELRLGRASDAEEATPSDPDQTHQEARAALLAALPGTELGTFTHLNDGRYLNERTGEIVDALP